MEESPCLLKRKRPTSRLDQDITVGYDELRDIARNYPLGHGSYAVVYRAVHAGWGCNVAYKELKLTALSSTSSTGRDIDKK